MIARYHMLIARALRVCAVVGIALVAGQAGAASCQLVSEVCVDGRSTRNISGIDVTRDCWKYAATYQCRSASAINDCQPLRDRGCAQTGANCIARSETGECLTQENLFSCQATPDTYVDKTVCDASAFCQDGAGCYDTSAPPDKDFGQAIAMLEASREAGVYGINAANVEVFKGYQEKCSIKVLGGATLSNCCNSSDGGQKFTNYMMLGAAGAKTIVTGSKYVYDALYKTVDGALMNKGIGAANGVSSLLSGTGFTPTFGMYGFTFSFSFSTGFTFVGFDPYSFAFAVAMQLVKMWLQCSPEEQTMSLKRGQNLCVHTDTYCSKKALSVCIERKQNHCCFNSVLARLINRQGRAQLGLPMNQCGGFNQGQLQQIDFSRIDFTEFIATIAPKNPDQGAMTGNVQKTVTDKVQSYYGNGE